MCSNIIINGRDRGWVEDEENKVADGVASRENKICYRDGKVHHNTKEGEHSIRKRTGNRTIPTNFS